MFPQQLLNDFFKDLAREILEEIVREIIQVNSGGIQDWTSNSNSPRNFQAYSEEMLKRIRMGMPKIFSKKIPKEDYEICQKNVQKELPNKYLKLQSKEVFKRFAWEIYKAIADEIFEARCIGTANSIPKGFAARIPLINTS